MPEAYNESELEQRFKQMTKYVKLGLLSILVLGLILFPYLGNAKQNEIIATQNQQIQAQAAINSDICKVYPDQEFCKLAQEIADDPGNPVVSESTEGKDGKDGRDGEAGRGVASFATNAAGDLIVTYTDGKTQNAGRVLGAKGETGEPGANGRGIISSEVISGSLIIRYSDGTSQNMGVVVGPKGATGETGAPGKDGANGVNGTNGVDGVSVSRVYTRADDGMVIVELSNGVANEVGKIISTTIKSVTCTNGTLTVTMTDGLSASAGVRCADDPLPYIPTPVPDRQPEPTQQPQPSQPAQPEPQQ